MNETIKTYTKGHMAVETSLFTKRFDTGAVVDVAEDFTLPDYRAEMRRIIGVRAKPTVDGKYLSGEELEADGGVTYTVLYMGGDGSLAQTSETTSYTGKIPLKSEDDRYSVGDLVLGATVDGVNCRVTGPRKFTLTSRVKLSLLSQRPTDVSLKTEKPKEMAAIPAVRKKCERKTTAALFEVRKNSQVSGEIRAGEGMRVVMAQGDVAITDVRVNSQNKKDVTVKGDAFVNVLLCSPEGEYSTVQGRSPIEEVIILPEMSHGTPISAVAFGSIVLIEIEGKDDGTVLWQMEYDMDCDVMRSAECDVVTDAYLTGMDDKLTRATYTVGTPAAAVNGRLTTSASAKLRDGATFVCAWGNAHADKCEISGGRGCVSGSVKVTVITKADGEFMTDEVSVPLKYEFDALHDMTSAEDGTLAKRMQVNVTDVGVRSDGTNLNITAELSISCVALASKQVTATVGICPEAGGGDYQSRGNVIRVYVPDGDETAWDVEKRFRLGREAESCKNAYVI